MLANIYIYIYIGVCVCVCVCVKRQKSMNSNNFLITDNNNEFNKFSCLFENNNFYLHSYLSDIECGYTAITQYCCYIHDNSNVLTAETLFTTPLPRSLIYSSELDSTPRIILLTFLPFY